MDREYVNLIVRSMKEHPGEWVVGSHETANRRLGVSVWTANSYYGLSVTIDGITYGNVTTMSAFFGPLIPWRRRILRAARALAEQRFRQRFDLLSGEIKPVIKDAAIQRLEG